MKPSRIKNRLKRGEAVAMPSVDHILSAELVEMIGMLGYSCLWIDMEHSGLGYERLADLLRAARISGMDIIVRIVKGGYSNIIRPLELGANGLVLPHCKSAAEAREFVRMSKFAPLGLRGHGGGHDFCYGQMDLLEYVKQANEETFLIPQIEDKEAIEEIGDIAAVEGVDGLFVGPFDLSQSLGVTGQIEHPLIQNAFAAVAAACKKHGKWWGLPAGPGEALRQALAQGARLIHCTQDMKVLLEGFREALELSRADFAACGIPCR